MSFAISSLQNNYSYMSQGQIKPKLDNDSDGQWSKTELEVYASAYNRATDSKLDTDKIMSTYDADGDGFLSSKEQESINKDDALGLKKLLTSKTSSSDSSAVETDLKGLMDSMSSRNKVSFANAIFKSENQSRLWDNFGMAQGGSLDFNSIISGQMAYKAYLSAGYGKSSSQLSEYGLSMNNSMNMLL